MRAGEGKLIHTRVETEGEDSLSVDSRSMLGTVLSLCGWCCVAGCPHPDLIDQALSR